MTVTATHRIAVCVALAAAALVVVGCAPRAKLRTTEAASSALESPASAEAGDSLLSQDSIGQPPEPPLCTRVTELITSAALLGRNREFALANRLLFEASAIIESDPDMMDDEGLKAQLYEQISGIYNEVLPPEYADSATDEVAVLLFQNQLDISLDSVVVGPQDSAALAVIAAQKKSTYDVPIVCNGRVLRALHVLRTNKKGNFQKWLERSAYYLPPMKRLFADSGLPGDLAYLALIESGFSPKAYSRAKASGIWQFIGPTGDRYGLRRSFWLDERRDPLKSTVAAIRYLKALYAEFGDWYLALAAYNCGENGVRRAINSQGTSDFWRLTLPRETMNYVPEYLAAVLLAKNPADFGLVVQPVDSSTIADLDTLSVSECIDLARIEQAMGLPTEALRSLNPHILQWCTPPDASNVVVYMPAGTRGQFAQAASQLPPAEKIRWVRYRIRSGDNLGSIARTFRLPIDEIRRVNHLPDNRLRAGRYLIIPTPYGRGMEPGSTGTAVHETESGAAPQAGKGRLIKYRAKPGECLESIAVLFDVTVDELCRWNGMSRSDVLMHGAIVKIYRSPEPAVQRPVKRSAPADTTGLRDTYVVRDGDNLYRIALNLGVSLENLAAWNGKDRERPIIRPGEVLAYYRESARRPVQRTNGKTVSATAPSSITYRVKKGDNLATLSALFGVTARALAEFNDLAPDGALMAGALIKLPLTHGGEDGMRPRKVIVYEVKRGDTVWDIAQTFGIPVQRVYAYNNLDRNRRLVPGDTLRIVVTEKL